MPQADKSGIFVGLNRGHVVTKPKVSDRAFKANKSNRKGRLHPRVQAVREVVQEVCGLAPFQKKMVEMIKTGIAVKEKKAVKLARKRVGQLKRAKHIRDNLLNLIQTQRVLRFGLQNHFCWSRWQEQLCGFNPITLRL